MSSEDIANIRKYTTTRTQVRNLIKEFNLSRNLSVPTETLDFLRQQVDLDGVIEVTDDHGSWAGSKPIHRGYFLTFEPDHQKLALWHKLNSPFSLSVDSSLFQRNGTMYGIPLPINGPDNGLVGSVQIATGLDGVDDWVDIPHIPEVMFHKVLEGFTFHIKFAPCSLELSNGQPVTLYAKKDPASPKGYENAILSVLMPDGSVRTKLMYEGKEYSACAYNFFTDETEFGIHKWYDHYVRFSPIQKKLDLMIDNHQHNESWDLINTTPYPHHDTDWHVGRSTYTNRGLFWGGLADFRYYWDLFFTNQHWYNLFTNRITISNIPYGAAAVIGHSYITHSIDIGFKAGFEFPLPNGKGFITQGSKFLMKATPVTNDLIPVFKVTTYPKVENDLSLYYSIDYNAPVSNLLELVYDIEGAEGPDGSVSNDLAIRFDVGINTSTDPCNNTNNPPPTNTNPLPVYKFISWGDNDTTADARRVLDKIALEQGVSAYLFAGDGPYDTDSTDWINMMTQYFPNGSTKKSILYLAQGNHEHPESESQQAEDQIEAWMPGLNNSTEALEWTRAFKIGNVYVIIMNSQDLDLDNLNSTQYNWILARLNDAKTLRAAGQIDWIITMVHKQWFSLNGNNNAHIGARNLYNAHFRNVVDFMFHGHSHTYQIFKPIIPTATETNAGSQAVGTQLADGRWDFSKDHGTMYIINGNGGHENNAFGEDPDANPNVLYASDDVFGFSVLEIQGKQATLKAKSDGGNQLFTVKITRGTDTNTGTTSTTTTTTTSTGNLIWDSNVDGKWNQNARTVTDTDGSQAVNGKGIYMAASGDPRLIINGQGEGELEADSGHGRFYVKACNYNIRLEGEFKINDNAITSTTWKLRNRHGMGGDCENRFGGFGGHINRTEVGTQIELCHNEHESSNDSTLSPALSIGQWYGFKFTVQDVSGGVLQKIELDRKDNQGFKVVHQATKTNPPAYYVDKELFLEESEFWVRINNDSTASVTYRNLKAYDLDGQPPVNTPPPTTTPPNNNCPDPNTGQCPTGQHKDPTTGLCVPDSPNNPPPPPPPIQPLTPIGIVGDTDGSTPETIYDAMKAKNIVQAVHVGDFTYDSSATGDITQMNRLGANLAGSNALFAIGNHDAANEDGNSTVESQLRTYFGVGNDFLKAKRVNNVFFIMLNTQDSNFSSTSSAQYLWAKARFEEAENLRTAGTIKWIVVACHKPLICAPSDHPQDEEGGRAIYQALFNQYQVDFVFAGHNHLLEMSEPLSSPTQVQATKVTGQDTYDFSKPHGQVYIVTGAGGRTRDTHDSRPSQFRFANSSTFGWTLLTIDQTGYNANIKFYNAGATSILHEANYTKAPQTQPPPSGGGGGNNPPPPTGMVLDSNGIGWIHARGQQGRITQSRNESADDRWSGNVAGLRDGYELTLYGTFSGTNSSSHCAHKGFGPNHCGDCGYSEDGSCCCWYDLGIRVNGDVQLEIERPHPNNDDFSLTLNPTTGPLYMNNIGMGMNGNTIGLKWFFQPLIAGGTPDNGGIRIKMWVDTSGFSGGLPQNQWRLVVDVTDNGQIMGGYEPPDEEFDIEVRNSDTNSQTMYGGGIHWRKIA